MAELLELVGLNPVYARRFILTGDPPSPAHPPTGCVFHTRCLLAILECSASEPLLRTVLPGHFVACHLADTQGGSKISI